MSTNGERVSKLIGVGDPMIRVKLKFPPLDPAEGPVTDGPLIRVGDPLVRVKLTFQPVEPAPPDPPGRLPADADAAAVDPADARSAG